MSLKSFQKKSFYLVFTDLGMPGIPDWEIAEKIKQMKKRAGNTYDRLGKSKTAGSIWKTPKWIFLSVLSPCFRPFP